MKIKKWWIVIFLMIPLTACNMAEEVEEFQDGDVIIATVDTVAWQCPGGEGGDSSSLERTEWCVEQVNQGAVPTGTTATIVANDNGVFLHRGYLRVEITSYLDMSIIEEGSVIPSTDIRWVLASDFAP